jgi:hypothetical protein
MECNCTELLPFSPEVRHPVSTTAQRQGGVAVKLTWLGKIT